MISRLFESRFSNPVPVVSAEKNDYLCRGYPVGIGAGLLLMETARESCMTAEIGEDGSVLVTKATEHENRWNGDGAA